MKNTMTDLVVELEKLSDSNVKEKLIGYAKKGSFHDYRSDALCGKQYFIQCAQWAMPLLIESDAKLVAQMKADIANGEYDEELTDEDRLYLKKQIDEDNSISEKDKAFFKGAMGIS